MNGNQQYVLIYIALMFGFIFLMTKMGKAAELIPAFVS